MDFKNPLTYISLSMVLAFFVASSFHLYFCWKQDGKWRARTKCLCVPCLAIAAALLAPGRFLIYIGAILGTVGDWLLLYKAKRRFLFAGGFFFLVGHICYLVEGFSYINSPNNLVWLWILLYFIGFSGLIFLAMKFLAHLPMAYAVAGGIYGSMVFSNITLAIWGLIVGVWPFAIYLVGALLFSTSDTILGTNQFLRLFKRSHFAIMLPYLLGQFFIIGGLITCSLVLT